MEEIILKLSQGALDNLNYGWIVLFMAIESSFIPFPSEAVMIPAAYMAAESGEMTYPMVILSGTCGALIGAYVNYFLSLWLGRPLIYRFANSRLGHLCLINQEKIEKAEAYFSRRGAVSTLIGRMIPAIRQLISIPAGLARMSVLQFSIFTAIGAALWNAILVVIGYACHTQMSKEVLMQTIQRYSHIIGYSAIGLLALAILYLFLNAWREEKKKKY